MQQSKPALITAARQAYHAALLAGPLTVDERGIPANADGGKKQNGGNKRSIALAQAIAEQIGTAEVKAKVAGQRSGSDFEDIVVTFLRNTFPQLPHLRPGTWSIERGGGSISRFEQLSHLAPLTELLRQHPEIKASVAGDYLIEPDIVISRRPENDDHINKSGGVVDDAYPQRSPLRARNNARLLLHATVSCKWTIRSDRVQNVRTEAQNLIRNRKGRVPHIVAVTAEPLPSRLGAIAFGTADLDCLYHFALPELIAAHTALGYDNDDETLAILVAGKRLRDISDLPLDLAV